VVDDCRISTLLLRHILQAEGISSDSAVTGPEAVEKAIAGDYSLILLDIMLPGMDGFEVAGRIRRHPFQHRPRIILLTAMGEHFRSEKVAESGADGVFFKPIVPSRIAQLARRIVSGAEARDSKEPDPQQPEDRADQAHPQQREEGYTPQD
jgi:two-component system response regulator ResD